MSDYHVCGLLLMSRPEHVSKVVSSLSATWQTPR